MTWLALGLLTCHGERHRDRTEDSATDTGADSTDPCVDADGDGYPVTTVACDHGGDCDDSSDTTYPGAPDDTRDGVDQDCDGRDGPRLEASGADDVWDSSGGEVGAAFPALLSTGLDGEPILVVPARQKDVCCGDAYQMWRWGAEGWVWDEPIMVATATDEQLPYNVANDVRPVSVGSGGGILASFRIASTDVEEAGKVAWVGGGATGEVDLTSESVATWAGTVENGWFGTAVQDVGDVRGDEKAYFAVTWGPEGLSWTTSTLLLEFGPTGGDASDAVTALNPRLGLQFYVGGHLAGPIDFDGDGVHDVVMSSQIDAPNGEDDARGLVSIVPGPVPEGAYYVDELDERWGGTGLYSQLGAKLAVAGDLDNDGLDDLLISADDCGLNDNGTLYALRKHTWILPGGSPEGTIDDVAPAVFAEADDPDIYTDPLYPAGVGDLDGDGHLDVGLGSDNVHDPTFPSYHDSGVVWIASGPFSGTIDLVQGPSILAIWGAEEEDLNWVSGGDVNGDGLSDVVLSSNDPNAMGTSSAIYTFLSPF